MKLSWGIFLLFLVASAATQGRLQNGHLRGLSSSTSHGSESTDGLVYRLKMKTSTMTTSMTTTSRDDDNEDEDDDEDGSTSTASDEDSTSRDDNSSSSSTSTSSDDSPSTTGRDSSSDSSCTSSDTSRETSTSTSTSTSTDSSSSSERAESSERDERSSRLECRDVSDEDDKCVIWVTNVHQGTISRAYVASQGSLYDFEVTDYEVDGESSLESVEVDGYEGLSSEDASWDADVSVDSSGDVNTESDLPEVTCSDLMNNPAYQFQDSALDGLGANWTFTNDEEYPCTEFGENLIWFFIKERFLPT